MTEGQQFVADTTNRLAAIEAQLVNIANSMSAHDNRIDEIERVQYTLVNASVDRTELEQLKELTDEKIKSALMAVKIGGGKGWNKPILESKAIQDIGKVSDVKGYRAWCRKLKNAL